MNQLLFNAALAEFQTERFESSAALCQSILQTNPADEHALSLLALSLQSIGDLQSAAQIYSTLAGLYPLVGEYRANLGLMLRHLGKHDEAEAEFRHALSIPHAVDGTLVNYGLLLLDMGRVAEARHRFLDACGTRLHRLRRHPSRAVAYSATRDMAVAGCAASAGPDQGADPAGPSGRRRAPADDRRHAGA
jgi:tetratricopeptide (TPR) repeat protein